MSIGPTIIVQIVLISYFYQFYFLTTFNIRKTKKNDLIFKNLKFLIKSDNKFIERKTVNSK